ncbi:MAG: hypothetical protein IPP64_08080 [Bacteroidetes bacterium]|nr:hypothetical protein [Bacteroidota bacterium]
MALKQDDIVQTISLTSMNITLDTQGIVHVRYLEGQTIDVKEKIEEKRALLEITKGEKHPILISFDHFVTITKEAKEYSILIEPEQPFLAVAIIVDNLAYQLMADFYFKFYKPKVAYKVFKSYDKSIEWLIEIRKNPPPPKPKYKGKITIWSF